MCCIIITTCVWAYITHKTYSLHCLFLLLPVNQDRHLTAKILREHQVDITAMFFFVISDNTCLMITYTVTIVK